METEAHARFKDLIFRDPNKGSMKRVFIVPITEYGTLER
jgi:hypothetical protein